jgi:hypothetical protein
VIVTTLREIVNPRMCSPLNSIRNYAQLSSVQRASALLGFGRPIHRYLHFIEILAIRPISSCQILSEVLKPYCSILPWKSTIPQSIHTISFAHTHLASKAFIRIGGFIYLLEPVSRDSSDCQGRICQSRHG